MLNLAWLITLFPLAAFVLIVWRGRRLPGEGAYIAAGSAITEDVPPGALALGRARQVNKAGWAEARRAKKSGKASHGEGG